MATPWYMYPISQAHGVRGEQGVDLDTPFGTPITALYGGTVRWAGRTAWSCGSSGGEVTIVCNVPELGVTTSYYLHLNTVAVKAGDTVKPGQYLGQSGGQLSGGNWPVVNCPQKGIIYSTGPHTEFGFKASWVSGPGTNVDPTFSINQAKTGKLPNVQPDGSQSAPDPVTSSDTTQTVTIDPSAIEAGLLAFYSISSKTHRAIMQPQGFDGICEALDSAEQWADWNWMNPFGSLIADFKPWLIRGVFASIAAIIILAILYEQIKGPVSAVSSLATRVAVPESNLIPRAPLPTAPRGVAP